MPTPVFVCAACQKHTLHDWSTDEPVPGLRREMGFSVFPLQAWSIGV